MPNEGSTRTGGVCSVNPLDVADKNGLQVREVVQALLKIGLK